MENKTLTWEEIKAKYDHEWVQLVDYDWPEGEPYPLSGAARTHHSNKKEFHRLCREGVIPTDSALLYVGQKSSLDSTLFSPALIHIEPCDR